MNAWGSNLISNETPENLKILKFHESVPVGLPWPLSTRYLAVDDLALTKKRQQPIEQLSEQSSHVETLEFE